MAEETLTKVAEYRGDFISLDHKGIPDGSNTNKEVSKDKVSNNFGLCRPYLSGCQR